MKEYIIFLFCLQLLPARACRALVLQILVQERLHANTFYIYSKIYYKYISKILKLFLIVPLDNNISK